MSESGGSYHWLRPDVEDAPAVSLPPALASIDLARGNWVARWPPEPLTCALETGPAQPPHWLGDRIPLVSADFVKLLAAAGVDNFQSVPVRLLRGTNGVEYPGYRAFNVVGCVDAADSEASVGEVLIDDDPGPRRVAYTKLVLARARTRDLSLFRLADDPAMLIAHERIVSALIAAAPPQGWGLTPIEIATS